MRRAEQNTLEAFATRIEQKLLKAGDTSTMENLVCRHLTNKKNPQIAARMLEKLVEWRYGKAKERHEHTGEDGGPVSVEHTIKFGDGKDER